MQEVLVDCLNATAVVVGEDFHFGHHRRGNVALLRELGAGDGFEVVPVPLVGRAPTASRSRSAPPPSAGPWPAARSTSPPTHARPPVRGARHRSSSATSGPRCSASRPPTSRCRTRSACRPTASTPAGTSGPTAASHPCAINLGRRPTFYEHADHSLLEAHLLDFDGDLYGERAEVRFVHFLRSERKFDGIDALVAQLKHDIEAARHALDA